MSFTLCSSSVDRIGNDLDECRWLHVLLIDRQGENPQRLKKAICFLTKQQQMRLAEMENGKRRAEYTLSRLALRLCLESFSQIGNDRFLFEQSPKPPLAKKVGFADWYCSISHTATWVGVAVSPQPCAIDVEWMRPNRRIDVLYPYVFGARCAAHFQDCSRFCDSFYSRWGAKECAIKLDAHFCLDESFRPRIHKGARYWRIDEENLPHETKLVMASDPDCCRKLATATWEEVLRKYLIRT